ncbi:MAG: phage baseplate assembly protein V [Oscillospiraceae bacterium]|nr:phage baseplate assembly protein V [Oscillospiraceae bacterium]
MNGLILGTVTENYDAKHPGMVRVSFPSFDAEGRATEWLCVAAPYAGKDYGVYLLPEKGAQVIVGFIGGDAHCAVVLGSLWNTKNTVPAETADKDNLIRKFVTKGKHSITLKDGDDGKITVKSESGHVIEIDEKAKKIKIQTNDGKQKLELDENGTSVKLESGDKLDIKAETITITGKITLKGQSVTLDAENALTLKGKQVKLDGSTAKLNAQSAELTGANVKVESSGILTLKGSMTKIN